MRNDYGKINIIVIVIIIIVTVLLAIVAYIMIPGLRPQAEGGARLRPVSAPTQIQPIASTEVDVSLGGGSAFGAKDYIKDYTLFTFSDIIVNPATPDRFFVTTVSVEHRQADRKLPDELKVKEPIIRDRMIQYFSQMTIEELRDTDNRDIFRDDLMRTINGLLLEGRISDLFFEQFVVQ